METTCIADEVRAFFERTGCTATLLSSVAEVPAPTISNLVRGKRKSVVDENAQKLRQAMKMLEKAALKIQEQAKSGS